MVEIIKVMNIMLNSSLNITVISSICIYNVLSCHYSKSHLLSLSIRELTQLHSSRLIVLFL